MKYILIFLGLAIATNSFAQKSKYKGMPSLIWPKLYDVTFEKAKDKLGDYEKPIFSAAVKSLNGKTITIPGYMIPFQSGIKGIHFMFSSLPINACFFCGVGGPETVIEVTMKEQLTYSEKPIELRGVLKLNATDPDKMIYQLEAAEFIGEAGL